MSIELDILKLVCKRLEQAQIPYMLTGSFAANIYAIPRMTRDIDIVIELQKTTVNKLFELFKNDFYINKRSIDEAIAHRGIFNIIHNEFVFKVDFIIQKDTDYRNKEFQRKYQILIDDFPIWIVTPEDLIISKLCWAKDSGSEIQLKDIRNLLQTMKTLDTDYLYEWIKNLDLDHIYQKANADE